MRRHRRSRINKFEEGRLLLTGGDMGRPKGLEGKKIIKGGTPISREEMILKSS